MNYYVWLILAVGCFVGELFTMEFSLSCLGLGLAGASLASWLGFGIWVQTAVFALISAIAWAGIRPFARKHLYDKAKHVKTPAEEVIGKNAVVGNCTELKNCVLFDNVQVPHYNYVGDSVLGYRAHLGASAITSNVKSDKSTVFASILGTKAVVFCLSTVNSLSLPAKIREKWEIK